MSESVTVPATVIFLPLLLFLLLRVLLWISDPFRQVKVSQFNQTRCPIDCLLGDKEAPLILLRDTFEIQSSPSSNTRAQQATSPNTKSEIMHVGNA